MFHRKQHHGPPDGPFSHSDDCTILRADPSVSIPWSEVERGHWVRTCQCSKEHYRAPEPARVRLDPLDPATMRHLPQCEFVGTTDRDIIRVLPQGQARAGPGLSMGRVRQLRLRLARGGLC
jgi:hypothetical protein